ncbi:MAG: hypothetical protein NUV82_01545, partial [Candidatus Komeilibacteria bacterium]|nr:hypothetical protein [Candidatus Komeilibacteria bacterium]
MIARRKNKNNVESDRLRWLTLFFLVGALLVLTKLGWMQIFRHEYYIALADEQYLTAREVQADRGEILLQDYKQPGKY